MSADLLTRAERDHVTALRYALEPGEAVLIEILDRLAPDPSPINEKLVAAVCKKMQLTAAMDKSFARAVLEAAHSLTIRDV